LAKKQNNQTQSTTKRRHRFPLLAVNFSVYRPAIVIKAAHDPLGD
jgi:hypothetical protein